MQPELEMVRAVFRAEAEEHLDTLERGFLALEASTPGREALGGVFRALHTLKGNAGMMGFPAASELAHVLEDLLEKLVEHTVPMDARTATLLLHAVDALRDQLGLEASVPGEARPGAEEVHRLLQAAAQPGECATVATPGAAAVTPEESEELGAPRTQVRTLRVGMDRLDRMMDLTGEIAIARGRLAAMLEHADRYPPRALREAHREADRLYLDLQELVMKARMVPIGRVFQPFARTLRDLCAATGKSVRLEVRGEDVEVDAAVVDLLRDPLTHMVRNAVDHGIEAPDVRRAKGKDATGTLALRAFHEAGGIVVQVADDGAGLDRERIRARAVAVGLLGPSELPPDADLLRLIFEPGFSTAERVTELSGRGIGMDVVKRNIEALRGVVTLESTPGAGTTLHLRLPLTLSIIDGFSVAVGEDTLVLPMEHVIECMELPEPERRPGATGVLNLRGHALPYLRLRDYLCLGGERPRRESVVVVGQGQGRAGLAVDALLGQSQTVLKPLSKLFREVPGVSGSAILGTGRVALVLDVPTLLKTALQAAPAAA